eukprot:jgi/Chrzof1/11609/Cz06g02050.t1
MIATSGPTGKNVSKSSKFPTPGLLAQDQLQQQQQQAPNQQPQSPQREPTHGQPTEQQWLQPQPQPQQQPHEGPVSDAWGHGAGPPVTCHPAAGAATAIAAGATASVPTAGVVGEKSYAVSSALLDAVMGLAMKLALVGVGVFC